MRRFVLPVLLIALAGCAAPAGAQERERGPEEGQARPLITEDVVLVPSGAVRLQAGIAFQQDQDFAVSGITGDLTRLGDFGVRIGVSPNVEVQLEGTFQQYLSVDERFRAPLVPLDFGSNPADTHDVGDFTLATKIRVTRGEGRLPAFGVRFGFDMPNTNEARGIGLNSTNVFAQVLAGKTIGRTRLFGNVGVAILQAPTRTFAQNDVLLYGLAFRAALTDRVRLVGEVNGRYSAREPLPGTESRGEGRVGLQVDAAGLRWDAAGTFGLTRWSPRTGFVFGFTKDINGAFEPVIK